MGKTGNTVKKSSNKPMTTVALVIVFLLTGILYSGKSKESYNRTVSIWPDSINSVVPDSQRYIYIGAEKCASICHNNEKMGFQYEIISKSGLAKAYDILQSKKASRIARKTNMKVVPSENKLCLICHTTGGGLDTSFFAVTYSMEEGITCEACHKGLYKSVSFLPVENDCLRCHNDSVHKVSRFDFKERSEKIAHKRPPQKSEI